MKRRGRTSGPSRKAVLPKARKTRPARRSTAHVQDQLDRALRERDEALDQQTATAEILQTINESPGDLTPVFDAMVESAMRLCEADHGHVYSYDGKLLHLVAAHGNPRYVNWIKESGPRAPEGSLTFTRILGGEPLVHLADISKDVSYRTGNERAKTIVDQFGIHTLLTVPLRKEENLLGGFVLYRLEAKPFSDKQISLVQNFAAQAVIAVENARLLNELRKSLQQQTATSEVLKVISSSTGELHPVFQAMLENAVRICEAKFGVLFRYEDGKIRQAAMLNVPKAHANSLRQRDWFVPEPGVPLDRVLKTKKLIHTLDEATSANPAPSARLAGARSHIAVPMVKDDELVGAIVIYRQEVRPFTDKQIELVQNFAAQAVIAIENTRLLNELRESLQQQTATADVLKVISASPGNLEPVFEAILASATQICQAKFGTLNLFENNAFRSVALHNPPPQFRMRLGQILHPHPESGLAHVARTKQIAHIEDIRTQKPYLEGNQAVVELADLAGARTLLSVPMLKEDDLVGSMSIYRQEVRPFTAKQIELVKNFAAQAVIAIENTRLLNELRQRTDDLTESLQQQTATSEVLRVISSSTGELQPVFEAVLENATRLCAAKFGNLYLCEGDAFRATAMHNVPPAFAEVRMRDPVVHPEPGSLLSRIVDSKKAVHVPDVTAEQAYIERQPRYVTAVELGGFRSMLAVPMLRDGNLIGAVVIYRQEISTFSDKQIELVSNFAAQAVIAIENARLLSELRESLQQQTATADVLKVISRSAFDLKVVLEALIESATRLCGATRGHILQFNGEFLMLAAAHNAWPGFTEFLEAHPFRPGPGTVAGRAAAEHRTVHVHDVLQEPGYVLGELVKQQGYRTVLAVPIQREEALLGVIAILKTNVEPFTEKQIELVETFADQAVIAIENVRLLSELRKSLQQQTATADVLKVISRSTFDLRTVLDTLLQSAARLCEANQGTITQRKGDTFYRSVSHGFPAAFVEYVKDRPVEPGRETGTGRALLEGKVIHIPDVQADPDYNWKEAQRLGGFRTMLGVPMLREGVPVGVLTLTRTEVRPFTDKQIELVTTFADQAAIAIENVRLFESVEARTRELAASLENLRTTQDRLVQTQKLASLGQLTAGIAHEIKNPLNFVNNFSTVSVELIDELREALAGAKLDAKLRTEIREIADTLQGNLDKVVQHGKRADAIVKNMLLHSREGSGEHQLVDINALVEEGLNLAYHGARAEKQGFNIKLEKSFDPNAGEADIFPQDITRVLLNLISNGFYAATKRRAETNGGDYEPTLAAATKNLGDRVEITIRDNGAGIPADVKEKMFNPFFTTKPAGEGTGLGLSISHDIIVKQHGGSIEVETQRGEFTEIKIVLPRAGTLPQ